MKLFLFLLTLFLCSISVLGQQLGMYELTKGLEYTGIQLSETGFIKSSAHIMNHGGFLSRGSYKTTGDTLILTGIPWEGMESRLELLTQTDSIKPEFGIQRKMDSTFMNLSLEVYDEERKPVPICIISLVSNDSEVIATLLSDQKGRFQYWDGNGQVSKIRVGTLGFRSYEIDLLELRGYSTEIRIYLKHDDYNYYNKNQIQESYLINIQNSTLTFIGKDTLGIVLKLKIRE